MPSFKLPYKYRRVLDRLLTFIYGNGFITRRQTLANLWPFMLKSTSETLLKRWQVRSNTEIADKQRTIDELQRELVKERTFIREALQPLCELQPVMRWPKSPAETVSIWEPLADRDMSRAMVMEFIDGRRRDVVMRVSIPAVFEFWDQRRDFGMIDDALEHIGDAVAYRVTRELRFGLTGQRKEN